MIPKLKKKRKKKKEELWSHLLSEFVSLFY